MGRLAEGAGGFLAGVITARAAGCKDMRGKEGKNKGGMLWERKTRVRQSSSENRL